MSVSSSWLLLALAHFGLSLTVHIALQATGTMALHSLLFSLSVSQLAVLAVWLTFGPGRIAIRLILYFILGVFAITFGDGAMPSLGDLRRSLFVAIAMALAISLPLGISWLRGWRLMKGATEDGEVNPWQLSIKVLLVVTLLVALLLPLHRYVTAMGKTTDYGTIGFPPEEFRIASPIIDLVTLLGIGLSVGTSIWACLATNGFRSGLFATSLIMALVLAVPLHIRFGSIAHVMWVGWMGTAFMAVLQSLLFLRYNGVRFARLAHSLAQERKSRARNDEPQIASF